MNFLKMNIKRQLNLEFSKQRYVKYSKREYIASFNCDRNSLVNITAYNLTDFKVKLW